MCTKAMSSAKKGESKNALSLLISVFGFGFFHRAKPVSQQAQSACWRQHCRHILDKKSRRGSEAPPSPSTGSPADTYWMKNPGEAAKRPEPVKKPERTTKKKRKMRIALWQQKQQPRNPQPPRQPSKQRQPSPQQPRNRQP